METSLLLHDSPNTLQAHFHLLAVIYMIIALYWADSDISIGGDVWHRESTELDLLARAGRDIRMAFVTHMDFEPTWLFIATWDHVPYYGGDVNTVSEALITLAYYSIFPIQTNTFQCVMITDEVRSFVIFNYADNEIQWTTGDASDGMNGLGGIEAQVGFNAGDGIRYASVPGSQTPDIINIDTTSNVGTAGVWLFRVDTEEMVQPPVCVSGSGGEHINMH